MPPITFIAAEGFTALVAPVPRAARAGDLLLAAVLTTDTATLTEPDGWSVLDRLVAPTNAHAAIWLVRRRIEDPEPATHAFAVDAGDAWGAVLLYRGLTEAGLVASVAADQASSASHKTPSATAATYSDLLLSVWAEYGAVVWTAPGTMTARFNGFDGLGATTRTILVADKLPETTGSIGGSTATVAPAATAIACSIMLAASPPPQAVAITRPTPGAVGIMEV